MLNMRIQDKKDIEILDSIHFIGPFELSMKEIDLFIPGGITGNYLLGYKNIQDDSFNILYIGHAIDLNTAIRKQIRKFSHFKYTVTESLYKAYLNDCILYHIYKEESFIINDSHPTPPDGTDWRCSLCGKNGIGKK